MRRRSRTTRCRSRSWRSRPGCRLRLRPVSARDRRPPSGAGVGHEPAGVAENELDVRDSCGEFRCAPASTRPGWCRAGSRRRTAGHRARRPGQFGGMDEDDRRAGVECGEQIVLAVLAEVRAGVVGQQHDTVGAQLVERSDRFVDGDSSRCGIGHGGEEPEPVGLCRSQFGDVVVEVTRERGGIGRVGQERGARRRHRQDRGADVELRHRLQRPLGAPVGQRPPAGLVDPGFPQCFR